MADRPPPLALPLLTSWIGLITPLLGSTLYRRRYSSRIRFTVKSLESLEIFRATFARCLPHGSIFFVSNRSAHGNHGGYKAYFAIMCLAGVTAVGAVGEIAKVSQGFQPGA